MADASDSKSDVGNYVWVQVPSPAFAVTDSDKASMDSKKDKSILGRFIFLFHREDFVLS